jgi:hypothetical protein
MRATVQAFDWAEAEAILDTINEAGHGDNRVELQAYDEAGTRTLAVALLDDAGVALVAAATKAGQITLRIRAAGERISATGERIAEHGRRQRRR